MSYNHLPKDLIPHYYQSSSLGESSSEKPLKMRSLREINEVTEHQDGNLNLYCPFMNCDPICLDAAIQEDKWKKVIDEEFKANREE